MPVVKVEVVVVEVVVVGLWGIMFQKKKNYNRRSRLFIVKSVNEEAFTPVAQL